MYVQSFHVWLELLETDPNAKAEQQIFTKKKYSEFGIRARTIFREIVTNLHNFHKADLFWVM